MHVTDRATRIRALRPEVPESVERLVDRMMSKDAAHRFADYASLLAAMARRGPVAPAHRPLAARRALGIDSRWSPAMCLVLGWWALRSAPSISSSRHSIFGRTVGKWLLKLQVTSRDGRRIGWKAAALRFCVFAWGPVAWGALLGGLVYASTASEHISFTLGRLTLAKLWVPLLWLGSARRSFSAGSAAFCSRRFTRTTRAARSGRPRPR